MQGDLFGGPDSTQVSYRESDNSINLRRQSVSVPFASFTYAVLKCEIGVVEL